MILSMIHTPNFVLYIATKPHFLIFASFQSIFNMTVWNTIDDRYSIFLYYVETKPHIFTFASSEDGFVTIQKTKLGYVSSIVFHTAILKIFRKRRKSRSVASFLYRGRTKLENLSSIVFHTVLLKMLSKMAKIKICDFVSA